MRDLWRWVCFGVASGQLTQHLWQVLVLNFVVLVLFAPSLANERRLSSTEETA
jgi:hypothetical protein